MKQLRSPGLRAMRLPSIIRAFGCPLRGMWHTQIAFSPELWEHSSDGIFAADADNKITLWNQAAEAILGYTREQACALTVDQLWVTEEAAAPYPSAEVPGRLLRHRNGGAVYVELTSDARSDPVRQLEYVLYTFRDVTDLKVAHIINFLHGKYGDCFEATPDAFLIINITGNIVLVNSKAEQLFGHRARDLLGQPAQMLVPAGDRGKHHARRSGLEGQPGLRTLRKHASLLGLRKDGSMFPMEVTLSPLQTDAGTLVCSAIRDSTQRRRHEQGLREPNRLESEVLASMSHELRTPLNGILGFTEFILDEKPGPLNQKQKEYLGDVLTSGRDLLQLINDILDLSRIEAGKIVPKTESFRLPAALNEVMAPISQSALDKNLALIVEVADSEIMLDRSLLIQVLYNLISNAVKFTERGEVRIKLTLGQNHCLVVEVSDTGIGIHADNIDRLFVYFQRLDASSTRRQGSAGLGLVLTRKIVELQKGSIAVSSEQGIGSTFTVTLPLEGNPS